MDSGIRTIDARSAPITLHDALCLGLKNVPSAMDLITRKSLIPNEMLRQVSVRRGA
jgi:hypothetical protein